MPVAAPLFGSNTLPDVLALVTTASDDTLTAREVCRRMGGNVESTQRAMRRLAEFGLAHPVRAGREVRYTIERTDTVCFRELRAVSHRLAGMGADLRRLAHTLPVGALQQAFIYGSVAAGTERPESDVDVFVVGTAHVHDLTDFTWRWSERLRRDVVPFIRTQDAITNGFVSGTSFYQNVLLGHKILLVGTESDLPTVRA